MQAIITKALSPTNTQPMRVKAKASAGSIIVPWNHELGTEENHHSAAIAFADSKGWHYEIITGQAYNGDFVHIMANK